MLTYTQCDETHPQCNKCIAYGVTCNYDSFESEDLLLPGEGAFSFASEARNVSLEAPPKDSMSPDSDDAKIDGMVGMPMELHDTDEKYLITKEDVELLRWFKDQTVFTIGTAQTVHIYRHEIVGMLLLSVSYSSRINWSRSVLC